MKALLSAALLAVVGFSSTAMAQIAQRCTLDDQLVNPTVAAGRNAWARRCGFITTSKEAYLNSAFEYQVFSDGCYAYPNVIPLSTCRRHVPASESAACIPLTEITKVGTCPVSFALSATKETFEGQHGDNEVTADLLDMDGLLMGSSRLQALWADLHHRLLVRDEADVRDL
jgi:hypothetical protein